MGKPSRRPSLLLTFAVWYFLAGWWFTRNSIPQPNWLQELALRLASVPLWPLAYLRPLGSAIYYRQPARILPLTLAGLVSFTLVYLAVNLLTRLYRLARRRYGRTVSARLAAIFCLLLIAAWGFSYHLSRQDYFRQSLEFSTEIFEPPSIPQHLQSRIFPNSSDTPGNYTNHRCGYSLNYPTAWRLAPEPEENSSGGAAAIYSYNPDDNIPPQGKTWLKVGLSCGPRPPGETPQQGLTRLNSRLTQPDAPRNQAAIVNSQSLIVAGQPAFRQLLKPLDGNQIIEYQIFTPFNILSIGFMPADSGLTQEIEQILASLKFVKPPDLTWKQYNNADFGFLFHYPQAVTVTPLSPVFPNFLRLEIRGASQQPAILAVIKNNRIATTKHPGGAGLVPANDFLTLGTHIWKVYNSPAYSADARTPGYTLKLLTSDTKREFNFAPQNQSALTPLQNYILSSLVIFEPD